MSYSNSINLEVCANVEHAVHCRIACLAGIVLLQGSFTEDGELKIKLQEENLRTLAAKLIRHLFDVDISETSDDYCMKKGRLYINKPELVKDFSERLKLRRTEGGDLTIDRIVLQKSCCKRAFIKGCFISSGSITDPNKGYHLEFVARDMLRADYILDILSNLGISAKKVTRCDNYIVYIKDSEAIRDALGILGASNGLMEYENVRILKEIRNSVNREVNCDTANMNKVANAAAKDIEDIEFIEQTAGLGILPDSLRELAETRLLYPYLSLKELGDMMNPPLGKSGVNHRIRRIRETAEKLRVNL